jgi:preprotein translocase subunit SecB
MTNVKSKKTKKREISPAEYNRYLENINLLDIYLVDSKLKANKNNFGEKGQLRLEEESKIVEKTDTFVKIADTYKLKAKSGKKIIFSIDVVYHVSFGTSEDIPLEFFDIFNSMNLPVHTFPYLREFVHSMVAKMGLPSLVLPLKKFLVGEKNNNS